MKPWEVKKTEEKIRKLSGEKTVKIFMELSETAIKTIRASIRSVQPKITPKKMKLEVKKIIKEGAAF